MALPLHPSGGMRERKVVKTHPTFACTAKIWHIRQMWQTDVQST
jgi:hypothetical protein